MAPFGRWDRAGDARDEDSRLAPLTANAAADGLGEALDRPRALSRADGVGATRAAGASEDTDTDPVALPTGDSAELPRVLAT